MPNHLWISRRDFFKWLIYLSIILSFFTIFTINIAGVDFVHQVMLTGRRIYNTRQAVGSLEGLFLKLFTPLILTIFWMIYNLRNRRFQIIFFWLIISLATGIYFSGGAGVNINVYFDTFISISVLLGLLLSSLIPKYKFAKILPLILSCGILVAGRMTIIDNVHQVFNLPDLGKQERINLNDSSFLANRTGNVLCVNNIFICYLSRKPFEYDPFNSQQMIATRAINKNVFLDKIKSGYFSTILLDDYYDTLRSNSSSVEDTSLTTEKSLLSKIRSNIVKGIADFFSKKSSISTDQQLQYLNQFDVETAEAIHKHFAMSHKSINGTFYIYK